MFLSSITSGVLVFLAVFLFTYLLWSRRRLHNLPPALPWLPIVGSLPFMGKIQNLPRFLMETSRRLGNVFSLYAGSELIVVLNGRETIRAALITKATDFADRRVPMIYAEPFVNPNLKGIFFRCYDAQLKTNRQLSLSILKEFGLGKRVMETKILMEVEEFVKKIRDLRGKAFDPHHAIMSSITNLFLSLLFGRRYDHNHPYLLELVSNIKWYLASQPIEVDLFNALRFIPYYRRMIDDYLKYLKEVLKLLDATTVACLQEDPKPECYVTNFVEAVQPNCDMEELKFIIRDYVCAGSDTLTTTLRWAIINLANNRKVQSRLHAEIDANIGRQRLPVLDDRPRLPYVEATLLEVLRHETTVPLSVIHATSCDTEINGYFVPAATVVVVNLYSAHMNPDDWQNPDLFNPDRFLDDAGNVVGKDRIITFSLGKRSCLGEQLARQELFLYFAALFQQFDILPPEGHDRVDVDVKECIVYTPTDFNVRLVPRNG